MCDAGALFGAQTLLALGGAIVKSNSDMAAYNKKVKAANAQGDAVVRSTILNYAMDGLQEQQVQNQEVVKEGQARDKLVAATGEAAGAAASSGVTGNSVEDLFRSYATATGKDIMLARSDAKAQIAQGEAQKRGQQMSAKNQLLSIAEGLPDDPTNSIVGNFIGAALGVGNAFAQNTTKLTGAARTGGVFGNGGFLGMGREFG